MDPSELKRLHKATRKMMKSCSLAGSALSQPTQSPLREQVPGECASDPQTLSSSEAQGLGSSSSYAC